jgi:hypothetical protein
MSEGFSILENQGGNLINGSIVVIAKVIIKKCGIIGIQSRNGIAALFINAIAALPLTGCWLSH